MATKQNTQQEQDTLVDRITDHFNRFMSFEDRDLPMLLALWDIHTYTFSPSFPRSPFVTPYIYVYSDGPECGKSTLIELCQSLAYNPENTADMTSAAMFRLISGKLEEGDEESIATKPTLFIDEVDTVFTGGAKHDDLRRTLNSGYKHSGYATRVSGKSVEQYSTFCPKFMAGIRAMNAELPETVRTRSIPVKLTPGTPGETYYNFMHGAEAEEIAEEIRAWVAANGEKVIEYMPKPGDGLERRAFEVAFPLLQLAHFLGCEQEARAALTRLLAGERPKEKPEVAIFRTIRDLFLKHGKDGKPADKIHSATIAEEFGWSTKHLSQMIRPFGVAGGNTMSVNGKTAKGYLRSQFEPVWKHLGITTAEEE